MCVYNDVNIIFCYLKYDVELIWRQQGNDIMIVAAICAAAVDFLCLVVPVLFYIASQLYFHSMFDAQLHTVTGLCSMEKLPGVLPNRGRYPILNIAFITTCCM